MSTYTVYADETDPDMRLAWYVGNGTTTLRDFTDWTISVEVLDRKTGEVVYTKTTGCLGGDGVGSSNVNVAWTADELADIVGIWPMRVSAVNGTERAVFKDQGKRLPLLEVKAVPVEADA